MSKQQLLDWLIPSVTDKRDLDSEIITNKKLIFMVSITVGLMIIAKVLRYPNILYSTSSTLSKL